jgi:hypothetical protein
MALAAGAALADGWVLERLAPDGGLRFVRAPAHDRRRAVSRLVVMAGSAAVALALTAVSAQSADNLWLITSSLIVLFGVVALIALLAAVKDVRRAALGVFLEVDRERVRGVVDGAGLLGQFQVRSVDVARADARVELTPFEDSKQGAGMLVITLTTGERLLAPDLPRVDDLRPLVARLG